MTKQPKPNKVGLVWESQSEGGAIKIWRAMSGKLQVGYVLRRTDGSFAWSIDAVQMKWIAKGFGDCASFQSGKQSVNEGWLKWRQHAGLVLVEVDPVE